MDKMRIILFKKGMPVLFAILAAVCYGISAPFSKLLIVFLTRKKLPF
jgi:hypothetical protein